MCAIDGESIYIYICEPKPDDNGGFSIDYRRSDRAKDTYIETHIYDISTLLVALSIRIHYSNCPNAFQFIYISPWLGMVVGVVCGMRAYRTKGVS